MAGRRKIWLWAAAEAFRYEPRRVNAFSKRFRVRSGQACTAVRVDGERVRNTFRRARKNVGTNIFLLAPLQDFFAKLDSNSGTSLPILLFGYAIAVTPRTTHRCIFECVDADSLLPANRGGVKFDARTAALRKIVGNVRTVGDICCIRDLSRIGALKVDTYGAKLTTLSGAPLQHR